MKNNRSNSKNKHIVYGVLQSLEDILEDLKYGPNDDPSTMSLNINKSEKKQYLKNIVEALFWFNKINDIIIKRLSFNMLSLLFDYQIIINKDKQLLNKYLDLLVYTMNDNDNQMITYRK